MNKFVNFLNKMFTNENQNILEAIKIAYIELYKPNLTEGINDLNFVYNSQDMINELINYVTYKRRQYPYFLNITSNGFEYENPKKYKGKKLKIKWSKYNEKGKRFLSNYDNTTKIINIPIPDSKLSEYNGTTDSIISVIKETSLDLIHELRHWKDNIDFDISKRKYTRLSQLEQKSLEKLQKATYGLFYISGIKYINQQTEINAIISEFIDSILKSAINEEKKYGFNEIMDDVRKKMLFFNNLTEDMKKRLTKRLYVFTVALNQFIEKNKKGDDDTKLPLKDRFTNELKKEIINNVKNYTGIIESIDYNHSDILNRKDVTFFLANYNLDEDYKNWFEQKYMKNGKCKVHFLKDYVEKPVYKKRIFSDSEFGKW